MSDVWFFFKKLEAHFALCNLCAKKYKTSGNTSNLKSHLKRFHLHAFQQLIETKKRKRVQDDLIVMDEPVEDAAETLNTLQGEVFNPQLEKTLEPVEIQNNQPTLKDIIERNLIYQDGGKKHSDITQALVYMVCKDNLPFSCVEKYGLKKFVETVAPKYKIPSRYKLTSLVEQRYLTTKELLKIHFKNVKYISLTSDIVTITNSTRSFLLLSGHFVNITDESFDLEALCLTAQALHESHTADSIENYWLAVLYDFGIEKRQIISTTTDGGSNMIAAAHKFLGKGSHIPCMAHLMHIVVNEALEHVKTVLESAKDIVAYFKHSVSAMDELKKVQGGHVSESYSLIQSVKTRWNSTYDMLERFLLLSNHISKVLAERSISKKDVPDMIPSSGLNTFKDLIELLKTFKEATSDISGENYVTASLAIPMSNLLRQTIENIHPLTDVGESVKSSLLSGIASRLIPLEGNILLAKATLLDPRFKKIYFSSALAASKAITELSSEIHGEHRAKGHLSPITRSTIHEPNTPNSIWEKHEQIVSRNFAAAEVPSLGSMPSELKQYLDQPNLKKDENPLKFWTEGRYITPVLSDIAIKYLTPPASSVPSERLASTVNLTVPNNRSRLTGEHIKQRVLLMTSAEKYWLK